MCGRVYPHGNEGFGGGRALVVDGGHVVVRSFAGAAGPEVRIECAGEGSRGAERIDGGGDKTHLAVMLRGLSSMKLRLEFRIQDCWR